MHPLRPVATVRQSHSAFSLNPADVEKTVTVVLVEQFHDVGESLFPGKIEVDLAQVCIRIADCPACTVYGEVLVVQRQVAEPGHQHDK